jgi:hypothetical protein
MAMGLPRSVLIGCAAIALLSATASAETTAFIVPNFDGYGIDQCLADGRPCGQAAAAAWCRSRDYSEAVEFGRLDRTDTTASVPVTRTASSCAGSSCSEQVAIVCVR